MSLTKLPLGREFRLFPARESFLSDIPDGDRKIANFFTVYYWYLLGNRLAEREGSRCSQ
jgi:hypothetical protein